MPNRRLSIVVALIFTLAALGLAAYGVTELRDRPMAGAGWEAASDDAVPIGGPFVLTDHTGKRVSEADYAGKYLLVFFGFTHCPDVCPTTLARLVKLRRQIGKGDEAMSIVFVSVDPERDGPAEVGSYAQLFNAPVIGLTGSTADIERVKKQFGVYSAKVAQPGGGYSVDHSAAVFLMDRDGKFVATLSPEEGDAVALDKLRRISA
jgi:protein SCO1/2